MIRGRGVAWFLPALFFSGGQSAAQGRETEECRQFRNLLTTRSFSSALEVLLLDEKVSECHRQSILAAANTLDTSVPVNDAVVDWLNQIISTRQRAGSEIATNEKPSLQALEVLALAKLAPFDRAFTGFFRANLARAYFVIGDALYALGQFDRALMEGVELATVSDDIDLVAKTLVDRESDDSSRGPMLAAIDNVASTLVARAGIDAGRDFVLRLIGLVRDESERERLKLTLVKLYGSNYPGLAAFQQQDCPRLLQAVPTSAKGTKRDMVADLTTAAGVTRDCSRSFADLAFDPKHFATTRDSSVGAKQLLSSLMFATARYSPPEAPQIFSASAARRIVPLRSDQDRGNPVRSS
jgi:hypothetical protein